MNWVWYLHQTPSHGVKSIAHMNEYWCVITNQFTIAISVRAFFPPQNLSVLHQSQFQLTWPLALALNIANISIGSDKGKHISLLRPVSSNCFLLSSQTKRNLFAHEFKDSCRSQKCFLLEVGVQTVELNSDEEDSILSAATHCVASPLSFIVALSLCWGYTSANRCRPLGTAALLLISVSVPAVPSLNCYCSRSLCSALKRRKKALCADGLLARFILFT